MQKYKVFINDRKIILASEFSEKMLKKEALFFFYQGKTSLTALLDFFEHSNFTKNLYIICPDIARLRDDFFAHFQFMEAAGGLVWDSRGRVLFIYRREKWDLPKGKIEKGERAHEAAVREVAEETGLSHLFITQELCLTYHIFRDEQNRQVLKCTHWYEMDFNGDETPVPQLDEDITKAEWFERSQMGIIKNKSFGSIREVMKKASLII